MDENLTDVKRRLVAYPLQMADGVFANLQLPEDLARSEARRLAEYISALVTVEDEEASDA